MESIENKIKEWSHLHYVAYLYLCVGKSDYSLVDDFEDGLLDEEFGL